jgi:predicted amidohydrolase
VTNFKIAAAQVPSIKGDIEKNRAIHLNTIDVAVRNDVSVIIFPELSLTGYEPKLAGALAFTKGDSRLLPFVEASTKHGITIIVGAPIISENDRPKIGAFTISQNGAVSTYTKMHLHPGEDKYFSSGNEPYLFVNGQHRIAIAICADTNHTGHPKQCRELGATIYASGVLITEKGYEADITLLQQYAQNHAMLVVMANHNKATGGFEPCGQSAIWSPSGKLLAVSGISNNSLVVAENKRDIWQAKVIDI